MAKSKVSEDEIREAAYHKWMADGAPEGKDQDYWLAAEAELTAAPAKKTAPRKKPAARKPAAKKPAARKKAAAKA